MFELQAMQ